MTATVGVIMNARAGKDIRRLAANAPAPNDATRAAELRRVIAGAHHAGRHQQDAVEGGANTAHTEFIEGAALIEPIAQAGAALHKALQEGGDRHQAEAAGDDQPRQHHLAHQGEIAAHINDRKARHRDRRGDGEQGLPQAHSIGGAQRCSQDHRAHHDHQSARHHRELGHCELMAPALQLLQRTACDGGGHPAETG